MYKTLSFFKNREIVVPTFLLIIISLCIFILLPLKAQTAGDDYFYAYSVKKSIEIGQVQVAEASTAAQVFPIVWAILFSAIFGFSYQTLHLSTVALLPVILLTVYFLLKQFKLSTQVIFFASLFFISIPFIFQYAVTFLTDLPFLSLELIALLFLIRGIKRGTNRDLFLGSIISSLAFLTRQLGIFMPLSAIFAMVLSSKKIPVSKKLSSLLAIAAVPTLTVIFYFVFFGQGSVSQHNMSKNVAATIQSLTFMRSFSSAQEVWSDTIYETLEYLWLALGFFSFFVVAIIISNYKRYLSKKALKPLLISLFFFSVIIIFEKSVYLDKTYLGFPLVLYRYESLFPMFWPHIWKYLVLISFMFISTETMLSITELKITKTAVFLATSFLLVLGSTAITGPDPKRYVIALLPFILIYICALTKNLKISGAIAIPLLLFVLADSLQMTKLRYDTNALAQQKALELVNRGVDIDRVLPNLEHTWSLWYTIEDKYNLELQKAGGDKLKVKYPVTPGDQDFLIVSKENIRYGNLPKNYIFIQRDTFNSLFVSSYLLTVKKL